MTSPLPELLFEHTFAEQLEDLCLFCRPARVPAPRLVLFNSGLARYLGMDPETLAGAPGAELFSGNVLPGGVKPVAQAYAGHQFGYFNPRLGDGRAVLIGEFRDPEGQLWDIQLKGTGPTPFSRGGDGKAALGPMLREYLMGEAMTALGIASTRGLAVVVTGEQVIREEPLPGAILTRIAASHIRVGTFQYARANNDREQLRKLADYSIMRHYPELLSLQGGTRYLSFLQAVAERQARLIARWMGVGFIHGVMNTDNMSIAGETIDYGPCAFMDVYNEQTVFSSIDHLGRYAYGAQPGIGQWNLVRLAESLVPLVDSVPGHAAELLTGCLNAFPGQYREAWREVLGCKIGLAAPGPQDSELLEELLKILADSQEDYTQFFRRLSLWLRGTDPLSQGLPSLGTHWQSWLGRWRSRVTAVEGTPETVSAAMDAVNPLYVPRNHQVEIALAAASRAGDFQPFHRLLDVVTHPFSPRPEWAPYVEPMPADFGPYRTFCGT